jgi:pimeloyl-ACP methyl ester carboxylesterase
MEYLKIMIPKNPKRQGGGNELHALHFISTPASTTKPPLIIICHGFPGDKFEHGRFEIVGKSFAEHGFDMVAFDFSGYGENVREPITRAKQLLDVEDVRTWAIAQGYQTFGTIGLSFGGLTMLLAPFPDRKVAVFWAPAFYMHRIVAGGRNIIVWLLKFFHIKPPIRISNAGVGPALLVDYEFADEMKATTTEMINAKLQQMTIPTLICQGTTDLMVHPSRTRAAFQNLPQDERHQLIWTRSGHNFSGKNLTFLIENSLAWFQKYLV